MKLELIKVLKSEMFIADATSSDKIARTEKKGFIENGKMVRRPYVKANNVRGRLRTEIAMMIAEMFAEQGKQMSLDVYRGLMCAASTGQPSKENPSIETIKNGRKNIYMGLLGGGVYTLASGLKVRDFDLITTSVIESGLVPEMYRNFAYDEYPCYPIMRFRQDRTLKFDDPNAETVVKEYPSAIAKWVELTAGNKVARKKDAAAETVNDSDKTKKVDLANMMESEVVATGAAFYSKWELAPHMTDAHLGLTLLGLMRYARKNQIGCLSSQGFGQFALNVKLIDDSNQRIPALEFDENIEDYSFTPAAEPYVEAAELAMSELNVDELTSFFVE